MNYAKLKGILVEKGHTYADVAKALNISVTAVSNKMNGHSTFDVPEANELCKWLDLDATTKIEIFFGN